jgi:hypothetical protein
MPQAITTASVQQYKANVELLLQQEGSRLRSMVTTGTHVGKAASIVEQFGVTTAVLKVTRHSDTPLLDVPQDKRWVFPLDYEWGSLIDNEDQLRMIVEATSPYARAAAAAMNRAIDDLILTQIFGTNFKGENGTPRKPSTRPTTKSRPMSVAPPRVSTSRSSNPQSRSSCSRTRAT